MVIPQEIDTTQRGVHPLKFVLWLLLVSIFMMFAAFTSAYIVRREEGNWLEFDLPSVLILNTIALILSSGFLQWAYVSAKRDNLANVKIGLGLAIVFGSAFLVGQWIGWGELVAHNVFFGGSASNPSGSFLYVLTGVHAFHLVTGLIFLIIVLISALKYNVHSKNLVRLELCTIYWHFLGALWVYLYLFLTLNH